MLVGPDALVAFPTVVYLLTMALAGLTSFSSRGNQQIARTGSPSPSSPHKVRQTAAAAISLPRGGMHLARLKINGHATAPTCLTILYNGVARACFPCPPGGQKVYDVDWPVGINLPATWCVSATAGKTGGTVALTAPTSWELTFDDKGYGPSIEVYRGIVFDCLVADSGTAFSVNYDEVDQGVTPVGAVALQTSGVAGANSRWAFPAMGSLQAQVEASVQTYLNDVDDAPDLPPAIALQLTPTVVGAATDSVCVVYY